MIAIVDYGVGNLFSLCSSLEFLNIGTCITNRKEDLEIADKIILPGVGAFADAIRRLEESGLSETLMAEAKNGKPLLGICLGMQLLFEKSYEYGQNRGLGLLKGFIGSIEEDLRADANGAKLKVPHIGWNRLQIDREDEIFKYMKENSFVYYVHSFYAKECAEITIASSNYDVRIPGIVKSKNIYGIQFHPEKSGNAGLSLLRAFAQSGGGR